MSKVFKSRGFIWPVTIATGIIAFIVVYFSSIQGKIVYPDPENYSYNFYTDEAVGGKSQILEHLISDSVIKMDFYLKEGFHSPYVGLTIAPKQTKHINAKSYNQISIQIKGQNIDRIGISLFTAPFTFSKGQDETLFHTFLNISEIKKTHHIPIIQFQIPEWWKDLHQIPETQKLEPDLASILHFNVGSAYTPDIKPKMTLELYSISFTRDNRTLFWILGLIEVIAIMLTFSINYLVMRNRNKTDKITVVYKPLEMDKTVNSQENYIEYINNNFSNTDLSLELVSKETSISSRRIAKTIQDQFNCNFKTYVNRIRINESKRFLTQTDLSIGEIAFKVGFNNQSHFNRVFKSEMQINPSEFRNQHK